MDIKTVGAIGAGTMGAGIAYVCALKEGSRVLLTDVSGEALDKAAAYHKGLVDRAVAKGKMDEKTGAAVLARIERADSLDALAPCDLVVEAASENMDLKKSLFARLGEICREDAVLGTNTSSMSITAIAAATKRPERVIGVHFFNPAPVMTLIELIRGLQTSDETAERTRAWCESIGKFTVEAKDSPGFITTRVGIVMMSEAIFLLAEGVGTAESIDEGIKRAYNHPMGPLALADLVGLDIVLNVLDVLYTQFRDDKYRPPLLLKKLVEAGRLGRKTGHGFYKYTE